LDLSATLEKAEFLPGEPAIMVVRLRNNGRRTLRVLRLDGGSLRFMTRSMEEGGEKAMRFVDPVSSPQDKTDLMDELAPGVSLERRFLFHALTMDRGDFLILAQYTTPNIKDTRLPIKVESEPVPFAVKGDRVFAHRYLNGLLTRENAVGLCKGALGKDLTAGDADAQLVRDEAGFLKWWVNIQVENDKKESSPRSFFVCPYLAEVVMEAEPFVPKENSSEIPFPETSRVFDEFRQRKDPQKGVNLNQ
jgi:hypothetical protein